jgi:hypothetical protein
VLKQILGIDQNPLIRIICDGVQMEDEQILEYYGLRSDSKIFVMPSYSPKFEDGYHELIK